MHQRELRVMAQEALPKDVANSGLLRILARDQALQNAEIKVSVSISKSVRGVLRNGPPGDYFGYSRRGSRCGISKLLGTAFVEDGENEIGIDEPS